MVLAVSSFKGGRVDGEDTEVKAEGPQQPPLSELVPAQDAFDREVIGQNVAAARQALANAKFKYHASKAGLPGTEGHLKQHENDCREAQRVLDVVEGWMDVGLPAPSPLAIASIADLPTTGA